MASRLERQRVLRQLNARLSSAPSRPGLVVEGEEGGLVVEGEKAALLLYRGQSKGSRIPLPGLTARLLPPGEAGADSRIPVPHPPGSAQSPRQPSQAVPSTPAPNPWQHPAGEDRPIPQVPAAVRSLESDGLTSQMGGRGRIAGEGRGRRVKKNPTLRQKPESIGRAGRGRGPRSGKMRGPSEKTSAGGAGQLLAGRDTADHRSRGGQLEERRARHLARKYWSRWACSVFGRVSPSLARSAHAATVQRRAMAAWKQQWWQARREWKLNIRADCHNRYRLWQAAWKGWSEYVELSKRRRRRRELADDFVSTQRLRAAWRQWRGYVGERRRRRLALEAATAGAHERLSRRAWVRWKDAMQERQEAASMATAALHHWALALQSQAWSRWLLRYEAFLLTRRKTASAVAHHRHSQLRLALSAWSAYIDTRRRKSCTKAIAREHRQRAVLAGSFAVWVGAWLQARREAEFQEVVSARGRGARLRRALEHWKLYVRLRCHRVWENELASSYHERRLKVRCWAGLRGRVRSQAGQARDKARALRWREHKCLEWAWSRWLRRCEHCEEIRLLPQTRRARRLHSRGLLRRVLDGWLEHRAGQRQGRAQRTIADAHFRSKAMPRCFVAMREFVSIQRYKRDLRERADEFRTMTQLSMVFYHWWRHLSLQRDVRLLERVAILQSEAALRRRALSLWRTATRQRQRQLRMEEEAALHHWRRLAATAFHIWKQRRQSALKNARQTEAASLHSDLRLRGVAWAAWTKFVARQRASHLQWGRAVWCHDRALLGRTTAAWKIFHSRACDESAKKRLAFEHFSCSLKRTILVSWSRSVCRGKMLRAMQERAAGHWKGTALRKMFVCWKERAALSTVEGVEERARASEASEELQRAKNVRLFAAWRDFSRSCAVERVTMEMAGRHHCRLVLARCLEAWSHRLLLLRRDKLLQRECEWFQNSRLLSFAYTQWRMEAMRAVVVRRQATLALWHWSHSLQRKVVLRWLLYVFDRRRKKERYRQALERYQQRLLVVGVTQWIQVASSLRAERLEAAFQQQTQSAQKVFCCVQRCAQRWMDVVRQRGTARRWASGGRGAGQPWPERQVSSRGGRGATELWTRVSRRLQLPARPADRPAPRRPGYMQAPPPPPSDNEALPHAPPPRLFQCPTHFPTAEQSFGFLPSTLSEVSSARSEVPRLPSPEVPCLSSPVVPRLSSPESRGGNQQELHPRTSSLFPPAPNQLAGQAAVNPPDHAPFEAPPDLGQTLLPPAAFRLPVPTVDLETSWLAPTPVDDAQELQYTLPPSHPPPGTLPHPAPPPGTLPPSPKDWSERVKHELHHMRDELRAFHALKERQRVLCGGVAPVAAGDGNKASTLQSQLSAVEALIREREPAVMAMAARLSNMLPPAQ